MESNYHGKVKPRPHDHSNNETIFDPMELTEVSTVKVLDIPYDIYESTIDVTISAAYCCESSEVEPDETIPKFWILVEDLIMSHIEIIDAKYDPDLLEEALNASPKKSNSVAANSINTMENEVYRLF